MMRTYIISLLLFLLQTMICSGSPVVPEKDSSIIYFRFDQEGIDSTYLTNRENIARIYRILNSPMAVDSVTLRVFSSPEGGFRRNAQLAVKRAEAAKSLFTSPTSGTGGIPESRIKIVIIPENWSGLCEAVEGSYFRQDRDKVIRILKAEGISDDTREWRLKQLDHGYTWDYLKRKYMPTLRAAVWGEIRFRSISPVSLAMKNNLILNPDNTMTLKDTHSGFSPSQPYERSNTHLVRSGFTFAVKTNSVYDLALIPNVAMEIPIGKGWSVGAGWEYSWWKSDRHYWYWRVYGGEVNLRKYFGTKSLEKVLSGHHVGLYAHMLTYDFETGGRGIQSRLSYGGGLEYGYSLPLTEDLNLDFGLGIGYLTGEYEVYDPEDGCYVWKETRQRHWFGPTKTEISLVWILDFKTRKGGAR